MESSILQLRSDIEILNPFDKCGSGKKPKFTKTGRLKAVIALRDALSRKPVIMALTAVSKQEIVRGPRAEADKLLGWAELSCVMLHTLKQVCDETIKSRAGSRSGSAYMRQDYMNCFRSVVKLSMQHGPQGVLRHLVRPFLSHSHEWLSEPSLRVHLADQIWQCVRELLQDEVNRALLLPPYLRTWVDACFEQLTGRGALRNSSNVVTNIAGDVLQILASAVESYDTLSQSAKRTSPSKMLGGGFGYAFIAERCCMMLVVAENMPRRKAREVQSVAFRTLAIVLSDHALDVLGSNALLSVTHASLKPLLTCWSEKKYHNAAVSFCKVLVLLAPSNKKLLHTIRHRVLVDLREEGSSAIIRAGLEISTDYVDTAAACFTFCECLEFLGAAETRQGVVILWLRVAFAIISRRILKHGTTVLAEATDVLDQCSKAAITVTEILKKHRNLRESDYLNIVRWSTRTINVTAVIANTIHSAGVHPPSFAKSSWQDLYKELREHAMKAKYSVRSRGTCLNMRESSVQADDFILETLGLLGGLEIIDNATLAYGGIEGNQVGSTPYPISKLLPTSAVNVTHFEIQYFRNLICRTGLVRDGGGHLRFQLISTLLDSCQNDHGFPSMQVKRLEEASSSTLALVRGECNPSENSDLFHRSRLSANSLSLIALHSFHSFFGLRPCGERIVGEGGRLVRGVAEQDVVWQDCKGWSPQPSVLANSVMEAVLRGFDPVPTREALKSNLSRHFSIDSHLTASLEQEMLHKLEEMVSSAVMAKRTESASIGRDTLGSSARGGHADLSEINTFVDCRALGRGLRIIVFLSSYLCQGIRLGLIPLSRATGTAKQTVVEELGQLLRGLVLSVAKGKPEHLILNFRLTQEAVRCSSRLFCLIDTDLDAQSSEDPESTWSQLSQSLSNSITSMVTSVSHILFQKLQQQTLGCVKLVQSLAQDDFLGFSTLLHDPQSRKRGRRSGEAKQRSLKRRRTGSPTFSGASINSSGTADSEQSPAAMIETTENNLDDGSEDSDDIRGFANDEQNNPAGEGTTHVDRSSEYTMSFWRKAFGIVDVSVRELPLCREHILEIFVSGLKSIDDAERILSPDGFERAAVLSSFVNPSILEARRSVWSVLFAIGTGKALATAAADLLKAGRNWKSLELTAHEYISFYADLLDVGQRKQYPVLPDIEISRVVFLDSSRLLFEKTVESDATHRDTQRQHPESELRYLTSEIVGVSEYFRNRHAFRMPRATRIAYIMFGCSFVNLVHCNQSKGHYHDLAGSEETSLLDMARSIQTVLCKFLTDSECIVRLVASRAVPTVMVLHDYSEEENLERILDDNLPKKDDCEDCSEFYGLSAHDNQIDIEDAAYSTWGLSNAEQNAFLVIHESFERLGASAKGYSTLLTLAALAVSREDLVPYCIIEIIARVSANSRFLVSGYQVIVRLCAALNYRSPFHFYTAYARIFLPKWFETPGSTEGLYKFPASLFVDCEHHKEGILYDWMREQQTSLLPHILVQEKAMSLDLTVRFAEALQLDSLTLLRGNVAAFSLLYPMQFTGGLHERGKLLWQAIDSLLQGKSKILMFEKKSEVIDAFLRSVSTQWQYSQFRGRRRPQSEGGMGFSRDTTSLKPPFYDPLVIALAINHLFASDSNLFIVQRSVLRGSLFAEVRDEQTGVVLADQFVDFLKQCQRANVSLLRILISTMTFFDGPPSPPPTRSRLDAFFCVGMLWRMLDDAILTKSKNERLAFYRLIAKGFQYEETAPDATWLLSDVQTKLVNLQKKYPKFSVSESDICVDDNWQSYLMCMTVTRERQMYELLSNVSPVLVSIMTKANGSYRRNLRDTASKALRDLLSLCSDEQLWTTILSNGPFPYRKLFKDVRKVYEKALSLVEVAHLDDSVETLLNSMARFRGVYKRLGTSETSVNILACLQEMNRTLDENTVNKLSKRIKSEAWLRSNGMAQHILPQINETLSCFIDMIYKSSASRSRALDLRLSTFSRDNVTKDGSESEIFQDSLRQEVAHVLSIFGLLHPQSASCIQAETYHKSIPARQAVGCYEEVETGIRHSLLLLQDLLQSDFSLQAQIALNTLVAVLKSNDGKRIHGREKELFENLGSFKGADRTTQTIGQLPVSFADSVTGASFSASVLPDLRSTALWSFPKEKLSGDYYLWMRKLCTVFAGSCRSNALNALSSACFSSYKVSCEMLPYLLMDIICDLDDESRSDVSKLLRHHVLLNANTPVPVLRAFVHALDVLCQIGLEVVSSKGILSWVRNIGQSHAFPYYYVLEVPYLEAAQAALNGGAYFSVLRYAQLYIDQRLAKAEVKLSTRGGSSHRSERRYSSCPLKDPAIESAGQAAREKVLPLVREAMLHISEPDGIRAFGESCSLAKSAANIAALDGDWSRSLAALDVATRNMSAIAPAYPQSPEERSQSNNRNGVSLIDFQKELDVLRSFIGLGTIHTATDYWVGLRNRVLRLGISEKSVQSTNLQSCLDQLNELRYASAWKLEQWESPPVLPQTKTRGVQDQNTSLGFHKAVYLSLRCLKTGRFNDVSGILSRARTTVLQELRDRGSTVSVKSIFENASRLYVCHALERASFQGMMPAARIRNASAVRVKSGGDIDSNKYPLSSQSARAAGESDAAVISESLDCTGNRDFGTEDVIYQIRGKHYGVDDKVFRDGLILSRDAFHSGILAEDLPVVLTRCLKRNSAVASVSATISARVLTEGGVGAWPRATSCLGTAESSYLADASQKDDIAWRMQETRLRWIANHDAPSKKQALAVMKEIISNDLGGKALEKTANDASDSQGIQQSLSWQRGDIDEETLALLRSEACCMAAKWSLEMKTHEPMDLFQMYLESGLTAASHPAGRSRLVGRAHYAMASFADAQIHNIDSYRKSRKYDGMVSAVKEMEEKISNLKRMKAERLSKPRSKVKSSRRSSRSSRSDVPSEAVTEKQIGRDLDLLIRTEQKKAMQDRARLERLDETYQKWQMLACRHFASSLSTGSTQDLRAAFRMVALWLDAGPMRNKITMALVSPAKESATGHRKVIVPVSKLLPLAPQLASRLNKSESIGDAAFQEALSGTMTEMAGEFPAHCLWQLLALSNATRDSGSQEKYSSLYRGDKDKKDAADEILDRLQHRYGETVSEMKKVADAYILLSETDPKRKKNESLDLRGYNITKLGELIHVPVPTVPIPLNGTDHFERIPHIIGFEKRARVCAGLSQPLRVVCLGSDGKHYPQMVKGKDDLRGDAVMEQMFTILNSLLEKDGEAARRSLHIRTYRIIPLSPFSGIMQFVDNTKQFREVLVGRETGASGNQSRESLHERYHPKDLKHDEMQRRAFHYHRLPGAGSHKVVQFLASVWHRFQPAFRFFFTEQWPDPAEWFSHQLSYSRSVAVMSMVGFILGLGDRHLANILLDISTAEVVHIDFGIAFEQGKLLPTPEHMPFRLTRDLVDGFGIAGVEGVFRRCSEITLSVMRRNKDVMLTVIEVLLHDPMYIWALTPEEVLKEQKRPQGSDQDYFESNEFSRSLGDTSLEAVARTVNKKMNGSREAHRALNRISEKLDGLEGTERLSVEAQVARLIDEAQAFHVIASVFPGWSPWL